MPEPSKNMYHETFLRHFSEKVQVAYPRFAKADFLTAILNESWEGLALKVRMRRITEALGWYLSARYEEALAILFAIDAECVGFPYLFFPDFVAVYGGEKEHWAISMTALERFTIRSSSEFAVRPFLLRDPERMMH